MSRTPKFLGLWVLGLFTCLSLAEADPIPNWSASYPPCNRHAELLKQGPMSLGVRVSTANPILAQQFKAAMNFWAEVLELDWHEEDSDDCSIQLMDGARDLFKAAPGSIVARSQFPDRLGFQGWIVFNPGLELSKAEMYRISVHEIGHMLGLHHNSNAHSLMYSMDVEDSESLDSFDLSCLASLHKLRYKYTSKSSTMIKLQN